MVNQHYRLVRFRSGISHHVCFALLLFIACCRGENQTRPVLGLPGSTADTLPDAHAATASGDENSQMFAGPEGEKSLEDMLHWAISNSDPEKLRSQAAALDKNKKIDGIMEQRKRVKELLEYMNQQPTETELMKDAIQILHDRNASLDEQSRALQALQILVEPIDSANDLGSLNGIQPVVDRLTAESPDLQLAAAYVLGTAASNNVVFQKQLLGTCPDVFHKLLHVAVSEHQATATKGLYAVASLVRNLKEARTAFYGAGGLHSLHAVLASSGSSLQVKRKALNLFADVMGVDTQWQVVEGQVSELASVILTLLLDLANDSVHEEGLRALLEMASTSRGRQVLCGLNASDAIKQASVTYQKALIDDGTNDFEHYSDYIELCKQIIDLCSNETLLDSSKDEL